MFLAAPLGGVISDRLDRRKVVFATQFALMVVALTLAILVTTDSVRFWHLYLTAVITGVSVSINGPTRNAMVHDLVDEKNLTSAVTLNSLSMNSMRVLGPAIGGVMIGFAGIEGTFWMQAACCIIAMTQVVQIRPRARLPSAGTVSIFKSLTDGISYIRRDPMLGPLLLIAFFTGLLGLGFLQLMPAYVGDVLHSDKGSLLGWLLTAEGIGALLGSLAAAVFADYHRRGRLLLGLVISFGLCLVVLGFVDNFAGAMVLLLVLGGLTAMMLTNNNVLIQLYVSEQYRGRVFSIYFLNFSLAPLGTLLSGALTKVVALQTTFIGLGVAVAIAAIWIGSRYPRLRRG